MLNNNIINIAAAVITNTNDEILLVRKQNSVYFMQAGGKIETNEEPIQTLVREIEEELGLIFEPTAFSYLGNYMAPAANEVDYYVSTHLFSITIANTTLTAHAELAEVGWYSLAKAKKLTLAPLTKDIILPILEKNKHSI